MGVVNKWVFAVLVVITALAAASNVNACWGSGCYGYRYYGYYDYAAPGWYYVPYAGCACWGYGCGWSCGGGYYSGYNYGYSYYYQYGYGYSGYAPRFDYGYHKQLAYYCANGWC
ncbi:MAG: hypothetical protein QW343_04315 [Candidatus Norongarragalinales archaeon]